MIDAVVLDCGGLSNTIWSRARHEQVFDPDGVLPGDVTPDAVAQRSSEVLDVVTAWNRGA